MHLPDLLRRTASAVVPCVIVAAAAGPDAPARAAEPVAPVVLLAVDGLEWDLALELIADGRMPNLARLMGEGISGERPCPR